jgi:hypothetical protein
MKTKTILKLLVIAVVLSFGFSISKTTEGGDTPGYCKNDKRYSAQEQGGGGREVTAEWAKDAVKKYRDEHSDNNSPYYTTGFWLSKKAFEKIFDSEDVNAMTIDLVIDEDGKLKVVAKGINTDKTGIESPVNSGIFISQSLCPNDCASY